MELEGESGRLVTERLVRENLDWLRGWFRGRLKDPEEAEDLCQESFLKALANLPRLKDLSRFPAWLYRIARNVLLDHQRSEARRRLHVKSTDEIEGIPGGSTTPDVERTEDVEKLLEAIRSLPEKLREPLILRHSRGLSYREIAEVLGIRENTVQVRIFRARKVLRKKLHV